MRIFKIIGICFLALGGLAVIVMFLLPLRVPQSFGIFLGQPGRTLWLLSTLGFAFGGALVAISQLENLSKSSLTRLKTDATVKLKKQHADAELAEVEKLSVKPSAKAEKHSTISKSVRAGASVLLGLGFASAVELFLLKALMQYPPKATSLWWLFVICSLLGVFGAIASWVTARDVLDEQEEEVKKLERKAEVRAKGMKTRLSLKIYRFNIRPYAAYHQKPLLQRRRDRTAYSSRDITTYSWH